jgi:hypothetical protein
MRVIAVPIPVAPAKAQSATAFLKDFLAPWRLCGRRFSSQKVLFGQSQLTRNFIPKRGDGKDPSPLVPMLGVPVSTP